MFDLSRVHLCLGIVVGNNCHTQDPDQSTQSGRHRPGSRLSPSPGWVFVRALDIIPQTEAPVTMAHVRHMAARAHHPTPETRGLIMKRCERGESTMRGSSPGDEERCGV